jgi:hypothetical protein
MTVPARVTDWRGVFPGQKRKTPALVAGVGPRHENLGVVKGDSNWSRSFVND